MPFTGTGSFQRTDGVRTGSDVFAQQLAEDVDVTAALLDAHENDIATGLEALLHRGGENAMTAALPMGGNKLTDLGNGTVRTDSVALGQAQDAGFRWGGTAGGTADALTVAPSPAWPAYANGQELWFIVASDNITDAPTIAVSGLAAIALQRSVGVAVKKRQLRSGALCKGVIRGVGTTPTMVVIEGLTIETPLPTGWIDGFLISAAADADHDLTIGGGATRANGDEWNIGRDSAITKRLDATWAVGDAAGGMQSGSALANNTWYGIHAIKRLDTGVVDVMAVPHGTSVVLPTSYDVRKQIGWRLTDGSANIRQMVQRGDWHQYLVPVLDVDTTIGTTADEEQVLSAPPDTIAIINANWSRIGESGRVLISSLDMTDAAVSGAAAPLASLGFAGSLDAGVMDLAGTAGWMLVPVDGASKIRIRAQNASTGLVISTLGFIDPRGKR
ncbi:MAG: hypothetical protein AB7O44_27410 [Hyphomicrobiaceae bacterium]